MKCARTHLPAESRSYKHRTYLHDFSSRKTDVLFFSFAQVIEFELRSDLLGSITNRV